MADERKRTRLHNKLKDIVKKLDAHTTVPVTFHEACELKRLSGEHWTNLVNVQEAFYKKAKTDADYEIEVKEEESQEATYSDLRMKLYPLLEALTPGASSAGGGSGGSLSSAATIKLPIITLPNFDGKFTDWISFKDLFSAAVATNPDLTNAQRLQYLKSSLVGEPSNLVKSFATTDANYMEAWKILESRYDNKREIVHSLIGQVMELKPVKSENAKEIQALLDGVVECLRSLKVQGCPVDKWDDMLVVTVLRKLDPDSRKEWAKTQTTTNLPTFAELETFINNHIRGLNAAGQSTSTERRGDQRVKSNYAGTGEQTCIDCGGEHAVTECEVFQSKNPMDRSEVVKRARACFNCMRRDHNLRKCTSNYSCRKCNSRHHTMLHMDERAFGWNQTTPPRHQIQQQQQVYSQDYRYSQPPLPPQQTQGTTPPQIPQYNQVASMPSQPGCQQRPSPSSQNPQLGGYVARTGAKRVVMKAIGTILDVRGRPQRVRLFIDPGAEADFILESSLSRLGLQRRASKCQVTGFGERDSGTTRGAVKVQLFGENGASIDLELLVMSTLTGKLPSVKCKRDWSHLQGIPLSDPEWYEPAKTDILLGIGCFDQIMLHRRIRGGENEPFAWETVFGWAVGGNCEVDDATGSLTTYHVVVDPIAEELRRFWEVEQSPKFRVYTAEEKKCEEHFRKNYKRDETGRFVVAVPFKDNKATLGKSRDIAIRRQLQVERRLAKNPSLNEQYSAFMKEYECLEHMKKVSSWEQPGKTNYLCHHFVTNDTSTTTKLRVVFDGSAATSSGVSLNDTMLVGAPVQDNLYDILLRWRTFAVVLKGDITKMFRQFQLPEVDANMHRIVWRETPAAPFVDYQLTTVTYGTACAPFLATRCIHQLGLDVQKTFPLASKALINATYVDDTIGGGSTEEETIQLFHQLTAAVGTAGMEMRKWTSNSSRVMEVIPDALRDINPLSFQEEIGVKTLGVMWTPNDDCFRFKAIEFRTDLKLTKRFLLSEIARVFDPLGLISCVVLRGKLLLQELWKHGGGWDQQVPEETLSRWLELRQDWKRIDELVIPRRITVDGVVRMELHGFADSSEVAFGAVCYLCSETSDGTRQVSLITSKTCVAPLRQVTLPRLELNAAVLLAEMVTYVMETLKLDVQVFLWTDSEITLAWISAPPKRWKTYVANRVATIQELTKVGCWHHVAGAENPADLASRGCSIEELIRGKLWTAGPSWLLSGDLPITVANTPLDVDLEERISSVQVNFVEVVESQLLTRFSSLIDLKKFTAIQFRRMLFRLGRRRQGPITALEMSAAVKFWIRKVQHSYFAQEIASLKRGGHVSASSKLKTLYPFLDCDGILRVGGRLENAQLSSGRKHQVILPHKSHLVTLLVDDCHHRLFHGGFQVTWSTLQQVYWVIGGRDFVRYKIRRCVRCQRFRAQTAEQLMGNLPSPRVTPARCFVHTGVDYAGPFIFKNPIGRAPKTYKGYMCLFICLVTKAIHLEAVSSLCTDAFIAALRRFVSIRGLCHHLYSDCGTNFVGADKELWRLVNGDVRRAAESEMLNRGINWHFNPPMSPHRGGLWEAGVKSAKHHIRRVVGNIPMTYEQFTTLICQVSAMLNSRPLYPRSSDPDDMESLTPGHFLIGEPLVSLPDEDVSTLPVNRLSLYQLQQQRLQHFWKRWSAEYLNTLQQRVKWSRKKPSLRCGDMVFLVEETSPGTWRMGRVIATHSGRDGLVRSVSLKTSTGVLDRAVNRVVPFLDMEEEELATSAKAGV